MHEDQVDHRGKGEVATPITLKPTLVDEESANSSVDGGYNDYTRPSGQGGSSDRFTK